MRILIATDGSEFSHAAIGKVCELMKNTVEVEIKLVSVFKPITIATEPFMASPELNQQASGDAEKLAGLNIEKARKTILERLPNCVITAEVLMGTPGQAIVENAEEWRPDLIVVGSHGRGFWARALLGSASNAVVHHAPCSVLVVKMPNGHNGNKNN